MGTVHSKKALQLRVGHRVGSQLGVVIVEEGLLEDGTEDPAPLALLRRLGGAEGGLS